jgi:hypothetical protein
MNSFLENTIIISCPVCYGIGSFPLYILVSEYGVSLLLSTYRIIYEVTKKRLKKNWWKVLSLISLALFLFLKSLFMVVPFPYDYFTDIFVCDQLPRYFLFLSFQFLVVWLNGIIFKGINIYCTRVLPIFLLSLSVVAFIVLVVFSWYVSV